MRVLQVIPDIGVANGVMSVILPKRCRRTLHLMLPILRRNLKHGKRRSRRWAVRYIGWMLPARRICATAKWVAFLQSTPVRGRRCIFIAPTLRCLLRRLPNEPGFIKSLCIATPLRILCPATAAEIGCSVYMPSIWCLRALRAAMRPAKCGTAIDPFGC